MAEHVQTIRQQMGNEIPPMVPVPFAGVHSRTSKDFVNKCQTFKSGLQTGVFDPRFAEVREYLIGIYADGIKQNGNWTASNWISSTPFAVLPHTITDPAHRQRDERDFIYPGGGQPPDA